MVEYPASQIAGREEPHCCFIRSGLRGNTGRLEIPAVELLARGLSVRDLEDAFRGRAIMTFRALILSGRLGRARTALAENDNAEPSRQVLAA